MPVRAPQRRYFTGNQAFGKVGAILAWVGIIATTIGGALLFNIGTAGRSLTFCLCPTACGSYLIFIGSSVQKLLSGYSDIFEYRYAPCVCRVAVGRSLL